LSEKEDQTFEQMVDIFAHYLRSPLTSIKGAASVLKQKDVSIDEDSKQELINIISEESERLNKIIDKLAWIVRIESGKLNLTYTQNDLLTLVESVTGKLSRILEKNVVRINIPNNLPLIALDNELISYCLLILLENSVKFSPVASEILISACLEETKIKLSIIDNGFGIAEEKQKEIFSKFYRPPQQFGQIPGVGMSLAICKGLIACHSGEIRLKSKVGQGTEIDLVLPISI
jgi:K+-sensing histidine kinase KdpD